MGGQRAVERQESDGEKAVEGRGASAVSTLRRQRGKKVS